MTRMCGTHWTGKDQGRENGAGIFLGNLCKGSNSRGCASPPNAGVQNAISEVGTGLDDSFGSSVEEQQWGANSPALVADRGSGRGLGSSRGAPY